MPTVLDNSYAAPHARVGGESSARAGPGIYAVLLHAARGEEVTGGEEGEPQSIRVADPGQPV